MIIIVIIVSLITLKSINIMFLFCQCSEDHSVTNLLFFLCRTTFGGMLHVKVHPLESVQK